MTRATPGLEHYIAVRQGRIKPRFQQMRCIPVANQDGSEWECHTAALGQWRSERTPTAGQASILSSLLDLKIALADQELNSCDLCPHHCRVNRNQGKVGFCGVGSESAVHWEGILYGEEIELVPSHEIFLSGCTMRCAFCYSHEHILRPMSGLKMASQELAACVATRSEQGATNLNLVGGEPTVHIPNILRVLQLLDRAVPVVWNSNLYATPTAMALLDGIVDLYLGDIHFGNPECAERLGRIPDYLPSVQAAFALAVASGASVIIRHLVMPGHLQCCARPAMEWAAATLPTVPFHLMFQYLPDFRAIGDPILGRPLSAREIADAQKIAEEIGVNLYREDTAVCASTRTKAQSEHNTAIGDTVDILIHDDGRVGFTRLLPGLVPVALALNSEDERVTRRAPSVLKGN